MCSYPTTLWSFEASSGIAWGSRGAWSSGRSVVGTSEPSCMNRSSALGCQATTESSQLSKEEALNYEFNTWLWLSFPWSAPEIRASGMATSGSHSRCAPTLWRWRTQQWRPLVTTGTDYAPHWSNRSPNEASWDALPSRDKWESIWRDVTWLQEILLVRSAWYRFVLVLPILGWIKTSHLTSRLTSWDPFRVLPRAFLSRQWIINIDL